MRVVGAVDLGASGGRVVAGLIDDDRLELETVHRFPNGVAERDGHLRWDIAMIRSEVFAGLAELVRRYPTVESIGIDTWAVDYGLLDRDGALLREPIAYRDDRTSTSVIAVHERVTERDLFAIDGLQFLPFNTIYQLEAERRDQSFDGVDSLLLIPDLIAYWLCGQLATEATNASTTGLVDVHTGEWSDELLDLIGLDRAVLPSIVPAGTFRGQLTAEAAAALGASTDVAVVSVASHDTASSVVAVPAQTEDFAYISSGTWSLVGLEIDAPVVSDAAFDANFTNEAGVDGTTRFLRNVGGLWLLQESLRDWSERGIDVELDELIAAAGSVDIAARIDVDDEAFIAPGRMPERIASASGTPDLADDPPALARCIFESLAAAYAEAVRSASAITGRRVEVVHVVGGGSQNELLCQLTADRCGLPVVAGPVEATALGNVLIQARFIGAAPSTLAGLRSLSARVSETRIHRPRSREEVAQ